MTDDHENRSRKLVSEELTRNIIIDDQGRQVSTSDLSVNTYESNDGETDSKEVIAEHYISGDGTIIAAGQSFRPESQGGVIMQRCDACCDEAKTFWAWLLHRRRPRVTWSPAKQMRRCVSCRRALCARHYVLLSADQQLRCRKCAQRLQTRRGIAGILRFMFLKKI